MVDRTFIKFGVLGGHVFTEVGLESYKELVPWKERFLTRKCVKVGVQSHHMKQARVVKLSFTIWSASLFTLISKKSTPGSSFQIIDS
jgi:hypothetical protein